MIRKVWITGRPAGNYLATVAMEIQIGEFKLQIRGMRLIEVKGKRVLAFPSHKIEDQWRDLVYPMTQDTREAFTKAAVAEYARQRTNEVRDLLEPL